MINRKVLYGYQIQNGTLEIVPEEQRTVIQTLITANVPLFEAALDEVDRRYGSMEAYLAECLGVTETLRRTLRDRFLE